jgi:hypothetical protein
MLPFLSALPLLLSREIRYLLRAALPLLAIGLVAASPAAAKNGSNPGVHASGGGGGALIYPSIVNRRLVRGERALVSATDYVDQNMDDKAVTSLLNARRNMYAAWRGAKYLIDHAPPPPVQSGSVRRIRRGKVHKSGSGGAAAASVPETAFAVLGLQHDVATTAFALMDGAKGTFLGAANTTVFAALNRRDQAIAYIHKVAPPAPVQSGSLRSTNTGSVHASGAPVAATFDTVMPGLIPQLDDEIQQIEGLQDGGAVVPKGKSLLDKALLQDTKTERTVNQFWPPLPAG